MRRNYAPSFCPVGRCGVGDHAGLAGAGGRRGGRGIQPGSGITAYTPRSLSSPSDTGASDISNLGSDGWTVQSSAVATQTGAQISTPGFNTSTWLPVTNDDAGAPGTEIEALAQNGKCPGDTALQPVNQSTSSPNSVFFSNNMQLLLRVHDQDRPGHGQPVQRALVVAHRLHAEPGRRARPPR